jgi:hypothetical protein
MEVIKEFTLFEEARSANKNVYKTFIAMENYILQ